MKHPLSARLKCSSGFEVRCSDSEGITVSVNGPDTGVIIRVAHRDGQTHIDVFRSPGQEDDGSRWRLASWSGGEAVAEP